MSQTDGGASQIAYAQQLLEELKKRYLRDLPETLGEIERAILQLDRASDFEEAFNDLYRRVHSVKGTAGTHGLAIITAICHQAEEALGEIAGHAEKATPALIDKTLAYVDLMKSAQEALLTGRERFPEIESRLEHLAHEKGALEFRGIIVEATRFNINLYLGLLKDLPIKFTVIDNGYQALERLLHEKFDILICGMELKQLNGLAMIAALRLSDSVNRNLASILLTSSKDLDPPKGIGPNHLLLRDHSMPQKLYDAAGNTIEQHRKRLMKKG